MRDGDTSESAYSKAEQVASDVVPFDDTDDMHSHDFY